MKIDTHRRQLIDSITLNEESAENTIDTRYNTDGAEIDSPSEDLSHTSDIPPSSRLSIKLQAPGHDRFHANNVDISGNFYQMQQHVFDYVVSNTLTLESDVHLLLSLNSILLLRNNNRPSQRNGTIIRKQTLHLRINA
ncbi:hypothetical protein BDB01DRAFT_796030, partial [Pilobolus umbonatus]